MEANGVPEPIHYDEVTLERLQLMARTVLHDLHLARQAFGEEPSVRVRLNLAMMSAEAYLTQYVWAQKVEEIEMYYPADLWQAVKEALFPRWAKRRWPVVHAKATVNIHALYPKRAFRPDTPHWKVAILDEQGTTQREFGAVSPPEPPARMLRRDEKLGWALGKLLDGDEGAAKALLYALFEPDLAGLEGAGIRLARMAGEVRWSRGSKV